MVPGEPVDESPDPLVLTARIDDRSFAYFDEQRRAHFPAALNQVPAHLTLFHSLPAAHRGLIHSILLRETLAVKPFSASVADVRAIGHGVAYKIDAAPLIALHRRLQDELWPLLTEQDQSSLWPHITVQNKVPRTEAERLARDLALEAYPETISIPGLLLWHYRGGPWERAAYYPFKR